VYTVLAMISLKTVSNDEIEKVRFKMIKTKISFDKKQLNLARAYIRRKKLERPMLKEILR